jgi:hypothetical protein
VSRALVIACALMCAASAPAAKVFAEAPMAGGAVVLLHDEPGPCVGGALLVQYVAPAGEITPGCWIARGDRIALVFLDGDVGAVQSQALRIPKQI